MPILRMETELVRNVGRQVEQVVANLAQQNQQLGQSVQRLSRVWLGSSRDIIVSEIEVLLKQLEQWTNEGSDLNLRLQREADEWEEVASTLGLILGSVATVTKSGPDENSTFKLANYMSSFWVESEPIFEIGDWDYGGKCSTASQLMILQAMGFNHTKDDVNIVRTQYASLDIDSLLNWQGVETEQYPPLFGFSPENAKDWLLNMWKAIKGLLLRWILKHYMVNRSQESMISMQLL